MATISTVLGGVVALLITSGCAFADLTSTNTTESPKYTPIPFPCLCTEFRCSEGGLCLDKSLVCNGNKDCPGGEDELLHTREPGVPCLKGNVSKCNKTSEFKCKFGGCILVTQVCDGIVDCFGAVDEASDLCTYLFS